MGSVLAMNHDYIALRMHEARTADLRAEARQHYLVRQALRAKRALARLGAASTVRTLPAQVDASYSNTVADDRKAA